MDGTTVIKNATAASFENFYRAVSVSSERESTNAAFSFKTGLLLNNRQTPTFKSRVRKLLQSRAPTTATGRN